MSRVQLYVYDLSGGLAKALSLQMTGKQIDGVWHTSVVVFGKEVFYGQGVSITLPGRSHHGNPLQIIDFGETAIDEETFNEYLTEIREHYTADKYHLLDFNCNSFTNDVIGFLTGQHIPDWIRDLPADFLSTPFGASLRPTIDNMFRRPTPGSTPPTSQTPTRAPPPSDVSNLLLQAVAQRAASGAAQGPSRGAPATSTVAGPMHISTNTASFNSLLETRKVAIALFTSANCGPCRMIEPAFEDYAREKGGPDIAFIKVSLDGMGGQGIAAQYGVRATPTFLFFLDGRKTDELKGANQSELKTQIDLLLYQAFPPHTHMSLVLPVLKRLSTQPTIYEQLPDLSKLLAKLSTTAKSLDVATAETSLGDIAEIVRTRGERGVTDQTLAGFEKTSDAFLAGAAPQDLFPLVDLWRLALLVEGFAARCMVHFTGLSKVLDTVSAHLQGLGPSAPKALALTGLRLQSNIVANTALLRQLFQSRENRSSFTQTLISGLLHEDAGVRTVASTLVFNIGTHLQRSRRESPTRPDPVEDGDWEVEVLTALLESLSSESDPGVVHRLVSAFGFIVLLSPWYKDQTQPLLEVLEAKKVLSLTAASAQDVDVKKLANECVLLCGSA